MDEDDSRQYHPQPVGEKKTRRAAISCRLSNEIVAAIRELVQLNPLYREHMQYFTQRVDIADPFKLVRSRRPVRCLRLVSIARCRESFLFRV